MTIPGISNQIPKYQGEDDKTESGISYSNFRKERSNWKKPWLASHLENNGMFNCLKVSFIYPNPLGGVFFCLIRCRVDLDLNNNGEHIYRKYIFTP